jgi:hypothetical protein
MIINERSEYNNLYPVKSRFAGSALGRNLTGFEKYNRYALYFFK